MSEYIEFRLSKQLPATSVWEVLSKKRGNVLGIIKYYGAWRQYAFFPSDATIWNSECLVDIIEFLKKQNYLRKGITYTPVKSSEGSKGYKSMGLDSGCCGGEFNIEDEDSGQ